MNAKKWIALRHPGASPMYPQFGWQVCTAEAADDPESRLAAVLARLSDHKGCEANARLMASAPALLAALQRIADGEVMGPEPWSHAETVLAYQRIARAALAAATGQS